MYSIVYMSIPISQHIPLLPFPHSNHVCFLRLWRYFCFVSLFISFFFLDSTYKQYHMIFVFVWLTLLSMIISRSIVLMVLFHYFYGRIMFCFFCVYIYMCIHTYIHTHTHHIFFTHSSVHGHLGCFHGRQNFIWYNHMSDYCITFAMFCWLEADYSFCSHSEYTRV